MSILKPVRLCLATLLMLVLQFSLGMIINLYVTVPPSDQHASFAQEVKTAPFALTLHVVIGLLLMIAAVLFLVRAIGAGNVLVIVLAAVGLAAILGAFVAGEMFVRNGQTSSSLTMALLTGAATASYIGAIGRLVVASRHSDGAQARATAEPDGLGVIRGGEAGAA